MNSTTEKDNPVRSLVVGIAGVAFVVFSLYSACIATADERGYLGVNKAGRQIFIQTLDHAYGPEIRVDSDFFDHPWYSRLLQEPMRTTIRLYITTPLLGPLTGDLTTPTEESVREALSDPYGERLPTFTEIYVTEDNKISVSELRRRLNKEGATTLEDFLGGLGFTKYEVYLNQQKLVSVELRQKKPNVKVRGRAR